MSRGDYLGLAWRNESAPAIFCQRDNALLSQYACARARAHVSKDTERVLPAALWRSLDTPAILLALARD